MPLINVVKVIARRPSDDANIWFCAYRSWNWRVNHSASAPLQYELVANANVRLANNANSPLNLLFSKLCFDLVFSCQTPTTWLFWSIPGHRWHTFDIRSTRKKYYHLHPLEQFRKENSSAWYCTNVTNSRTTWCTQAAVQYVGCVLTKKFESTANQFTLCSLMPTGLFHYG